MRKYFTKCTSCVVNYVSYDVIIPTNQIPKEQRISDVSVASNKNHNSNQGPQASSKWPKARNQSLTLITNLNKLDGYCILNIFSISLLQILERNTGLLHFK